MASVMLSKLIIAASAITVIPTTGPRYIMKLRSPATRPQRNGLGIPKAYIAAPTTTPRHMFIATIV